MAKGKGGNWTTLIPRVLLAVVFVFHGGQNLFGLFGGDGIDALESIVNKWGWPAPGVMARAAAATEFFGGVCLLIGLLTRFWAFSLAVVMGVAVWKIHWANGFSVADGGWEYNFVLAILCLTLVMQGGGAFSIDEMFFKKTKAKPKDP